MCQEMWGCQQQIAFYDADPKKRRAESRLQASLLSCVVCIIWLLHGGNVNYEKFVFFLFCTDVESCTFPSLKCMLGYSEVIRKSDGFTFCKGCG